MKRLRRLRIHVGAKRQMTTKRGIYFVESEDGTRSYIATWKEELPLSIFDPLTTKRRTIEKQASTFERALRLKAEGEAAERKRRREPSQGFAEQLGERVMAAKWLEYWVRR